MPFNIKIRKIQGGAVHDLKGLRCVSYFQGFENLAKETDLAVRKGMCFVGFGPGLSFDKIPSAYVFFDWISHSLKSSIKSTFNLYISIVALYL